MKDNIPGTNLSYSQAEDAFSVFKPMFMVTNGLALSQICSITGLEASTIQNWVKRGFVPRPEDKKYTERHLARILLISALRDCMRIEDIGELMVLINGDVEDESDDIVSESDIYDYFCKVVKTVDDESFNDRELEKTIRSIVRENNKQIKSKITKALKIMFYAYIIGKYQKEIDTNLKGLKEE